MRAIGEKLKRQRDLTPPAARPPQVVRAQRSSLVGGCSSRSRGSAGINSLRHAFRVMRLKQDVSWSSQKGRRTSWLRTHQCRMHFAIFEVISSTHLRHDGHQSIRPVAAASLHKVKVRRSFRVGIQRILRPAMGRRSSSTHGNTTGSQRPEGPRQMMRRSSSPP